MEVTRLDHLVLTVRSIERTCAFYRDVLGMKVVTFGEGRTALTFGRQKINLHQAGGEFEPKAARPTPGSADLCFVAERPIERVIETLKVGNIPIEAGPVARAGAEGPITSVYLRDPDANLVEIACYR